MSTHPNVILMAVLSPDDLSRKTMRGILQEYQPKSETDDDITIDGFDYHSLIMESDYNESWQIAAGEGDLVFFDLVTYGYGETVTWDKLAAQKESLERWAQTVSEKHHCSYSIRVTANYW